MMTEHVKPAAEAAEERKDHTVHRSIAFALMSLLIALAAGIAPAAASRPHAITPKSLALPKTAFSPATVGRAFVDPNSNNKSAKYWPRSEHAVAYGAFGRVSGYFQQAHLVPAGTSNKITFYYEDSIFKKAKGALGSWHDASGYPLTDPDVFPRTCPANVGTACTRLEVHYTDGFYAYDDSILAGQCLLETRVDAKKATFQSSLAQIRTTLDNLDAAGYQLASRVCSAA